MFLFSDVTFDQILASVMALLVVREVMVEFLPDSVVGPEGWLIRVENQD